MSAIRVVIADDAADIRMLIRFALDQDGRFDVVAEAADGLEALDVLGRTKTDALLLDLAMPRMDGLEVLEVLHGQEQPPPVVVFSGFTSQDMIDRAMSLGASSYIDKGTDIRTVPDILAEAVAARQRADTPG
jgi:DNA-binding NarL/FixJ family response regulator